MACLKISPSPSSNLCAIPTSFSFLPIDSFRAVFYCTCRGSLGPVIDAECGLEKRFKGWHGRVRDIVDSEAALVHGLGISLSQVLGRSEGRRTIEGAGALVQVWLSCGQDRRVARGECGGR